MTLDAINVATSRPAALPLRPGAARSNEPFTGALRRAAGDGRREEAREAATQLVSSAFVLPVLASLRESPFNDGPFAPGPAERRFGPLLDTHLADRISRSSSFNLPDVIVDRLLEGRASA